MRVLRDWNRFLREVMDSPFFEVSRPGWMEL